MFVFLGYNAAAAPKGVTAEFYIFLSRVIKSTLDLGNKMYSLNNFPDWG